MAWFEKSIKLVLSHEGGFVNNPNDTPTNWGITQNVYSTYLGRPASVSDVQAMPVDEAKKIYKTQYWNAIKGDAIMSQDVADMLMDMCVLRGVVAAAKSLQLVLGLQMDGKIGPITLRLLNATAPYIVMLSFQRQCVLAFCSIVRANPNKLEFVSNWCGRVLGFNDLILSSRAASVPSVPSA